MNLLKAIKSEKHYCASLSRLENLFDAKPGTPKGDEAELLIILIEDYEKRNYSIEAPSAIEAIRFRMEQMNMTQNDLVKYLGSASRVSEILNGKRTLTVDMIAALHEGLDIPFASLIGSAKTSVAGAKRIYKNTENRVSLAREGKLTYSTKKRSLKR